MTQTNRGKAGAAPASPREKAAIITSVAPTTAATVAAPTPTAAAKAKANATAAIAHVAKATAPANPNGSTATVSTLPRVSTAAANLTNTTHAAKANATAAIAHAAKAKATANPNGSTATPTRALPLPDHLLFRTLDNTYGLNSNEVNAITQDKKGFVWIGTGKGLQRYDGIRFFNCFGNAPKTVSSIYLDEEHGRILYYQPDKKPYQWSYWKNRSDTVSHADYEYHAEYGGDKWVVDPEKGLLLLNGGQRYSPEYNPIHNPLLDALHLPSNAVSKISLDSRGNLWLATWNRAFFRYHYPTHTLYRYSIGDIIKTEGRESSVPGWVSCILEDNHGALWLATGKAGLLKYDYDKDLFYFVVNNPGNNLSLQYNHEINTIFQDREENIWLGTDKGVSIFNPYRGYFGSLGGSNKDAGMEIETAFLMKNKDLYVGSWGEGIRIYDSNYQFKKQIFFPGKPEENQVWSFIQQCDGKVWAGCQHGFILVIDPTTYQAQIIHPDELEKSTIRHMLHDSKGNTLLALHSGKVAVWDTAQKRFLLSAAPPSPSFNVSMFRDHDNRYWLPTSNGLKQFDPEKRTISEALRPPSLPVFYCQGVANYDDSTLIVGSLNNGLWFFHTNSRRFTKIAVNEEQPFPSAGAVVKDSAGNIWFTSDYTICCYNPGKKAFFAYRPEKGQTNAAFKSYEFLFAGNDQWLTWTSAEVVRFNPEEMARLHNKTDSVTFTGFRIFSNPVFVDSMLKSGDPVKLSYKDNFVSIEFSNLQFSGIDRTRYYYQLEGVDAGWVYGGTRGVASYTNLPPGKYLFHVRTDNTAGNTASMAIWITAPFWATLWFRILVTALTAALLFAMITWHTRRLRKEAHMRQQIANTEMMALRAQMNPHFIFNCINGIDALIQSNDKYQATVYLNKFARLIRNVLDSSRQQTTSLAQDLETLQLYIDLELFRTEHAFTAEIKVDPELLDEDCKVPPLIIQPYVENAILHGLRNRDGKRDGHLHIDVRRQDQHLVYEIEDNGVGRSMAESRSEHRSYGMEMSRDRVDLFNGEDKIPVVITDLKTDGRPTGTRVQVFLKIS